jgi:hypothetical protein
MNLIGTPSPAAYRPHQRGTTTRVETIEYDAEGRIIKRVVTETTTDPGSYTYPYHQTWTQPLQVWC